MYLKVNDFFVSFYLLSQKLNFTFKHSFYVQESVDLLYSNIRESECSSSTPEQCEFAPRQVQDIFSQVEVFLFSSFQILRLEFTITSSLLCNLEKYMCKVFISFSNELF